MLELSGKDVANQRKEELKGEFKKLSFKAHLCVILVGEDKASQVYVTHKQKACESVGVQSSLLKFEKTVTEQELLEALETCNRDPKIHAILLQLPLPSHLNSQKILNHISGEKDVDALSLHHQGSLWLGYEGIRPCTPYGIMKILKFYEIPLQGKRAVVVGRSAIVGKPMAALLLNAGATVTICHSKTENLESHTRLADLVVVAIGQKHKLDHSFFKEDCVVVDVGIHEEGITKEGKRKLTGDVNPEGLKVKAFTPVPGGVGPMTICQLLDNTLTLCKSQDQK